ncbi:hypothetical protein HOY82DRAFT_668205 [Tuber indicum]|nr:hypothetical protein HOY82DRAFT_668205 [Tuber indicum]
MAPLPLAAPEAKIWPNGLLSSISGFLFHKSKPEVVGGKMDQFNVPVLFGLGIPKPEKGEDMPKATAMFPPESHQTEADSIWKTTGFANTDEYHELNSNPWNDYRKRSFQHPESSATTMSPTGKGGRMVQETGTCPLTMTQEISLLIFTWLAAILICGAIVCVLAKIEQRIRRFVDRGVTGFGEKQGWRRALHSAGYGSAFIVIIAMLLMVFGVMFSLKDLWGRAIWGA